MVSRHDGQVYWELVAENCQVIAPAPGMDGSVEVRNGVTGEVRHMQQQVIQFVHEDGDEDCVEVRRGTQGTQLAVFGYIFLFGHQMLYVK